MLSGSPTTSERAKGSGSTPNSYTVHTKPSAPAAATASRRHQRTPCSRSTPESLSSGHAEELANVGQQRSQQAGATPPQSQQCHAVEQARTRPAAPQAPGKRASSPRAKCPRCPGFGARDVRPRCPRQGIMFVASLCTGLWLTPSFTSQLHHKGQDLAGY